MHGHNKSMAAVSSDLGGFFIRNGIEGSRIDVLGCIDHSVMYLGVQTEPTNSWILDWLDIMFGSSFGIYVWQC